MPRGVWLIAFGSTLALIACDRVVIQHAGRGDADAAEAGAGDAAVEGGGPPRAECEGAADDAPCDDHDVCTPASSCRGGRCIPGNAFEDCTVADSELDFGTTQGEKGWYYGYWDATADPDGSYDSQRDFVPMEYCGMSAWRPPGRCAAENDQPGYRWTTNLAWNLQHPETRPNLELPIRRWVSDVSGPARLRVDHHVSGTGSDGTRAILLVDGGEIWRNDAMPGDDVGVQASFEFELQEGTVVEQIVHPLMSSADDTTYFGLVVEGR